MWAWKCMLPWIIFLCGWRLLQFGVAFTATTTSAKHLGDTDGILLFSTSDRDRSIDRSEWREYCTGCGRPPTQCLCEHLPREKIRLETRVLVLQHPVEFRRKTISTVPLLRLVLERCDVLVGRAFDARHLEDALDSSRGDESTTPLLLFPGPDAISLEDSDALERLAHSAHDSGARDSTDGAHRTRCSLVIVDGTWTQAKRMLRNSPYLLQRCRLVQFTGTTEPSVYDSIRKQPDAHCLSTLESCERTLRLLEPDNPRMQEASDHLLSSLRAMILKQMTHERAHWENSPYQIRNVAKLNAKKERQHRLLNDFEFPGEGNGNNATLPAGYALRPLAECDAEYVNSRWPFQSSKSLTMIRRQILGDMANGTKFGNRVCLGVEFDDKLVGCVIRHRNGSIGILHVDEEHRRSGIGELLLKEASDALKNRQEEAFAFIVDGNKASEALFAKLGWEKADPLKPKQTGKRRAKRLWILPSEGWMSFPTSSH
ncbi:hypothetical protein ACHAWF_014527 [Thalassiosira exigua]